MKAQWRNTTDRDIKFRQIYVVTLFENTKSSPTSKVLWGN